jgi:hypothetical protein
MSDISKALAYVGRDPEVDIYDFEKYFSNIVRSENFQENLEPILIKDVDTKEHGITDSVFNFEGGRQRMSPQMMKGLATNNPTEIDEYEVFVRDTISTSIYKKISFDPQVTLGLFLLKGWIGGLRYNVVCSDPIKRAIVTYSLDKIWTNLVRDMVDAVVFGFQFGEKVWERDEVELDDPLSSDEDKNIFKGVVLNYKKIKFLDPNQDFKFYMDETDEITKVTQRNRRGEVTIPRDKLVWFAIDKRHSGVFGTSRLKAVYSTWYYSQITNQLLLRDNEQRGAPHLEVRFPKGSTTLNGVPVDNSVLAAKYAQSIKSSGVVILPSETDEKGTQKWSVKYADTQQRGDSSPFMNYIKHADNRKLSAIGIPSAVLGDATFGQADAQADLLLVIIEDIVSQIEDAIQKDVLNQLVSFNWGPKEISKFRLVIDRSSLGRKKLFKEVLIQVLRIASSQSGLNPKNIPSIVGMCEDLGIPVSNFKDMFDIAMNTGEPYDEDDEGMGDLDREAQAIEDSNGINRIVEPDRSDRDRPNKSDINRE